MNVKMMLKLFQKVFYTMMEVNGTGESRKIGATAEKDARSFSLSREWGQNRLETNGERKVGE